MYYPRLPAGLIRSRREGGEGGGGDLYNNTSLYLLELNPIACYHWFVANVLTAVGCSVPEVSDFSLQTLLRKGSLTNTPDVAISSGLG